MWIKMYTTYCMKVSKFTLHGAVFCNKEGLQCYIFANKVTLTKTYNVMNIVAGKTMKSHSGEESSRNSEVKTALTDVYFCHEKFTVS